MFRLIIIFLIALVGFLVHNNYSAIKESQNERMEYQSNLGAIIIIDVDTFMVVDYDQWEQTYTLDNGLVVNKMVVNRYKVDDPWAEYVKPVK